MITGKSKIQRNIEGVLKNIACLLLILVVGIPLYVMLNVAFKSGAELTQSAFTLPKQIQWSNFTEAIEQTHFFTLLKNSVVITVISVVLMLVVSCMAAYVLARKSGKRYNFYYMLFVAGLMIPYQLIMLPLYKLISTMGLMNSKAAVILTNVGSGMPFLVFYFIGYLKSIPKELDEAALIDGASRWQVFWRIILPLMKTALFTMAVLQVIWVWNDFMMPLLYLKDYSQMTIMVGVYSFRGAHGAAWNLIFALVVLCVLPVMLLYVFFQKHIVAGFAAGAVKG